LEKKENINKGNTSQNLNAVKPIYSITPFTLLDYPDKTACILWFAGCNMKCLYCYNPDIVFGKGKVSIEETLHFLKTRKILLDGVVLSGGECTSYKSIKPLLQEIKKLGFLVKIDTNGSNPDRLMGLIKENLVDYIALDFKATTAKFRAITQSDLFLKFSKTLNYLIQSGFPFEVRTTLHSELLNKADISEMIGFLEEKGYHGSYYLQNYRNDSETIGHLNNSARNGFGVSDFRSDLNIVFRNNT